MSAPLSSLFGSLPEGDYHSRHPSTSSSTQRRQEVRKILNRESSLSVLASLDHKDDWNNKPSSTRAHRIDADARFGGFDSLLLIAAADSENQHDQASNVSKIQMKREPLKSKPVTQNQSLRIDDGWSNSSLIMATTLPKQPNKKDRSDSLVSSLATSTSIAERKPVHKASKHVQFGSSVLCQVAASFDEDDECDILHLQTGNASKLIGAFRGKNAPSDRRPLKKVTDEEVRISDGIAPMGHALQKAYAVAGKAYPKGTRHLKCRLLQRLPQQDSVLLLASGTNDSGDEKSDESSKVDDHFLSLFQNQATLNQTSKTKSSKPNSSSDDPFSKRTMLTSPSLTVNRRPKRRDRKKTPMGKINFKDKCIAQTKESPVISMEDSAVDNFDDDTASSLSDESITERWCQTSPVSAASIPLDALPLVPTSCLCDDEKLERAPKQSGDSLQDIRRSPAHEAVACESTEVLSPNLPPTEYLDGKLIENMALNAASLSECYSEYKSAESRDDLFIELDSAMSVDSTSDVAEDPVLSPSIYDFGFNLENNAIRRSRRVRVATDRYMPNEPKVSDSISEADPSHLTRKRDQTKSSKQICDTQLSKSMNQKDPAKVTQKARPSSTLPRVSQREMVEDDGRLSSPGIVVMKDTGLDQKPSRARKPTDFFHNHIQEFVPTKTTTLQLEPINVSEHTTSISSLPPKISNSGTFPPRPLMRKMASAIVEDLSALEGIDWTVNEIQQLHDAHRQVDPTSSSFWSDVANKIKTRTAAECRSQWFSLAKTPAAKSRTILSKLNDRQEDDNDDDIFQSTPMRVCVFPGSTIFNLPTVNGTGAFPAIPKSTMIVKSDNDSGREDFGHGIPRPFSKAFLQRMRKDHVKAEKGGQFGQKSNKGMYGSKQTQVLSEVLRDSEIDINVRLTPGGTLKVKSHVEEDDFWDEQYDDEE